MRPLLFTGLLCLLGWVRLPGAAQAWDLPLDVDLIGIKFDYTSGYTNDGLDITKNASEEIQVPEWEAGEDTSDQMAYIKSQTGRKIQAEFWSTESNLTSLTIKATKLGGVGLGSVNEVTVDCLGYWGQYAIFPYGASVFTISGSVPSSVGGRSIKWRWYVTKVNGQSVSDQPIGDSGWHYYYTLLAAPLAPMAEPWTLVLDYACDWAYGATTEATVCTDILSNGFSAHYTWNMNCHRLASNFVRLVTSLGVGASMHRWSSKPPPHDYVDMAYQRTKSIDPVGSTWGQGQIEWAWHQWADASGSQRDASTATSKSGGWGAYEDDLFDKYQEYTPNNNYEWVSNHSGQSTDCEAPAHRSYSYWPTTSSLLTPWTNPDR